MKILFFKLLAFFILIGLFGCVGNQNNHLTRKAASVTLDPIDVKINSPIVFSGTCTPDGIGSISLEFPGSNPSTGGPCDCVSGKYSCPAITFTSIPPKFDIIVTNNQGGSTTADDKLDIIAEVNLDTPTTFPAGPEFPINGTCAANGVDNITITSPTMMPSPIICSCDNGLISCPSLVSLDGSDPNPIITAIIDNEGNTATDSEPIEISELADVFGVFNGDYSEDGSQGLCFKGIDNRAYCWGGATGGSGSSEYPTMMNIGDIKYLVATEVNAFAITTSGLLYGWGSYTIGSYAGPGHGNIMEGYNTPHIIAGPGEAWDNTTRSIKHFFGDHSDVCAVLDNGELWTWGQNSANGELGVGDTNTYLIPVPVLDPNNPTPGNYVTDAEVATCAGSTHCYINTSQAVFCSGDNVYGQLGQSAGSTTDSFVYKAVPDMSSDVVELTSESWLSTPGFCARKNDGTVWCWGRYRGPGGTNTDTPTQMLDASSSPLTGITKIASGHDHTCALKDNGTVYCQGLNDSGQLGDGTFVDSKNNALLVPGITNAIRLGVGREHSCVLRSDDTIWCWGANVSDWSKAQYDANVNASVNGQTGNLTDAHNTSPVQFMASKGNVFKALKVFAYDTCGILFNGEIYCMGLNPGTANEGIDPVGNFIYPQPPDPTSNLLITVTSDKPSYLENDLVAYTVELKNLGPDDANNVILTSACPIGTNFVSATPSSGSYASTVNQWTMASLGNFAIESMTLTCQVNVTTSIGGYITNLNVSVISDEVDPTITGDNVPLETFVAFIPSTQCGSNYSGITSYRAAGDGASIATAYEIGNLDMYKDYLAAVDSAGSPKDRDAHIILCDDIDFIGETNPPAMDTFYGHFNGNGNKILNFNSINSIFSRIDQNGSLKNLVLENIDITCSGYNYCGPIARTDDAELDNISIDATSSIISDRAYVGGIIGYATGLLTLKNITSAAIVSATPRTISAVTSGYVGGVAGSISAEAIDIDNINGSGTVSSDASFVGGLFGQLYFNLDVDMTTGSGNATNLLGSGSVTYSDSSAASGSYIGGLIGRIYSKASTGKNTVSNASFTGTIDATQARANYVGGVAGIVDGIDASDYIEVSNFTSDAAAVINCGSMLNTSLYCGGILGAVVDYVQVLNSNSAATVTGNERMGGAIGYATDHTFLNGVSASGNVTCSGSYCGGLLGYATNLNTIVNSSASGNLLYNGPLETKSYFGGLIGAAVTGNTIANSFYDNPAGTIVGARYTGGLIGLLQSTAAAHATSLENSYVKASKVATIDGVDNTLSAGGLIGYADIRYITSNISGVFTNITDLEASRSIGGLISNISLNNESSLNISHSFASGGASFNVASANNYQFGGLFFNLNWSNVGASLNVTDVYTKVDLDPTGYNPDAAGSYRAFGGLVAYKYRANNTTFLRVYTNPGILEGQNLVRYGGGFIAYDRSTAGFSTTFNESFTAASFDDFTHDQDFLIGRMAAGTVQTYGTNTFFLETPPAVCTNPPGANSCNDAAPPSAPLLGLQDPANPGNNAISNWDFVNTWEQRPADYPKLRCPATAAPAFCVEWDAAQ